MSYQNRGVSHARGYLGVVNVRCDRCHHWDDIAQTYGTELCGTAMAYPDIEPALVLVRERAVGFGWHCDPANGVYGRDYCADCVVHMA